MPLPVSQDQGPLSPSRAAQGFGQSVEATRTRRAEAPRAPALPPALQEAEAAGRLTLREREMSERRSMLRGLLLLAILLLLVSVVHAGGARALPAGWFRQW